jgi:hypothetical protein
MRRQFLRMSAITIAILGGIAEAAAAQWTFVGYVGDAWTAPGTMTVVDASADTFLRIADVEYASRSWDRPLYWGVRAGRTVSRDAPWVIEFEYIHLKAYATPEQVVRVDGTLNGRTVDGHEPFRATVERFQLSHGLNLLFVNLGFERRVHPRFVLVVRGGAGPTLPHVEATIREASRDEYTWGRIGLQAAAGLNWSVKGPLFLTGELKGTFTRQRLDVGSATTEAAFATIHLIIGVGVRL